MATALTSTNGKAEIAHRSEMEISREQIELIKRTVAKGVTDDEFQLFLHAAKRMGLDPLAKQIHAVKRYSGADGREVMSIQTGIDGYRLIADRTGNYAPGKANSYEYDENGKVISATAYAMKFVRGAWMETSATAHMSEYAQTKKDGSFTSMWASKPHIMLGKCAEALALRRAFPAELSGVYTDDEMAQADNESVTVKPPKQLPPADTNGATWDLALNSWKFQKERALKHGGLEVQIERCKPHKDAATNKDIQAVLVAAECLGKVVDLAIGTPADDVIEA